jgi:hypothetical protein
MKYPSKCVEENESSMETKEKIVKEVVPPHSSKFTY